MQACEDFGNLPIIPVERNSCIRFQDAFYPVAMDDGIPVEALENSTATVISCRGNWNSHWVGGGNGTTGGKAQSCFQVEESFPDTLLAFADTVTRDIIHLFRRTANINGPQPGGYLQNPDHSQGHSPIQSEECNQIHLRSGRGQDQENRKNEAPFHRQNACQSQQWSHCQTKKVSSVPSVSFALQGQSQCQAHHDSDRMSFGGENKVKASGNAKLKKYTCKHCCNLGPMEELFEVLERDDSSRNGGLNTTRVTSSEHAGKDFTPIPMTLRQLPASFWHQPGSASLPGGIGSTPFSL